jgi:hypothetical protein
MPPPDELQRAPQVMPAQLTGLRQRAALGRVHGRDALSSAVCAMDGERAAQGRCSTQPTTAMKTPGWGRCPACRRPSPFCTTTPHSPWWRWLLRWPSSWRASPSPPRCGGMSRGRGMDSRGVGAHGSQMCPSKGNPNLSRSPTDHHPSSHALRLPSPPPLYPTRYKQTQLLGALTAERARRAMVSVNRVSDVRGPRLPSVRLLALFTRFVWACTGGPHGHCHPVMPCLLRWRWTL